LSYPFPIFERGGCLSVGVLPSERAAGVPLPRIGVQSTKRLHSWCCKCLAVLVLISLFGPHVRDDPLELRVVARHLSSFHSIVYIITFFGVRGLAHDTFLETWNVIYIPFISLDAVQSIYK
jgi:hypothetical protein